MRRKIKDRALDMEKYPGPGNYNIKSEILNENKILSSQKRYKCPLIRV